MPSGQMRKIIGTICNVPIDTVKVTGLLRHSADSNGLVYVKVKRKLENQAMYSLNLLGQFS